MGQAQGAGSNSFCSSVLFFVLLGSVQFMARMGGKFQVGAKDPNATGAALLRLYV